MRDITLDDVLRARLGDLSDEVAVRDATGQVVAYIVPPGHREMLYRLAATLFAADEPVDALREHHEGRCKTTADVLARIRALDNPEKVGA